MKKCWHFLQNTNARAHLLPEAEATSGAYAVGSQVQCFVSATLSAI
jgi:hypothetical protein